MQQAMFQHLVPPDLRCSLPKLCVPFAHCCSHGYFAGCSQKILPVLLGSKRCSGLFSQTAALEMGARQALQVWTGSVNIKQ